MLFTDRNDAAQKLAEALQAFHGKQPLILAIPRGAVAMGRVLADRLDGELDVVLVRKLRAPGSPEYAIGAIDEAGWAYISPDALRAGATAGYLEEEKRERLADLHRRRAMYTPGRSSVDPAGRLVIVVDDGLATGATMIAALHAVRQRKPAKLVCAVPVAARDSLELVRQYADEVVCLEVPAYFGAVGQFYDWFPQVEDAEVVRLLTGIKAQHRERPQ
jgi:putative phosphoribosyl transferase